MKWQDFSVYINFVVVATMATAWNVLVANRNKMVAYATKSVATWRPDFIQNTKYIRKI